MNYPQPCPHCDVVVDSKDSVADTMADLREHIKRKHPEIK